MKKIIFIPLVIILGSYTACHWDYYLSQYIFDQYCNEEGRVGLFVYERVDLGDEYFTPFPGDKDPRDVDHRFLFGDNMIINKESFYKDYYFNVYKSVPLSSIGPIVSIETSVVRKKDGVLLGKAVSLANNLGWWIDSSAFGNRADTCPEGRDEKGYSNYNSDHNNILREVFHKKSNSGRVK